MSQKRELFNLECPLAFEEAKHKGRAGSVEIGRGTENTGYQKNGGDTAGNEEIVRLGNEGSEGQRRNGKIIVPQKKPGTLEEIRSESEYDDPKVENDFLAALQNMDALHAPFGKIFGWLYFSKRIKALERFVVVIFGHFRFFLFAANGSELSDIGGKRPSTGRWPQWLQTAAVGPGEACS
jgi:hypothetical protein